MTQEQLNYVMLLCTHKDHTDNINLLEIAKEFVSFNDRRISFWSFLKFNNIMQLNYKVSPPNLNFIPTPLFITRVVMTSCIIFPHKYVKNENIRRHTRRIFSYFVYFSRDLEILFLFAVTSPEDINISTLSTLFSKSSRYSSPLANSMTML